MKSIYSIIILALLFQTQIQAQKNVHQFCSKYSHQPNTVSLVLPGWIVAIGLSVSGTHEEVDEDVNLRPLVKGLFSVRLFVAEVDEDLVRNKGIHRDLNAVVRTAKKQKFEELVTVREGKETAVHLLIRHTKNPKKNKIRNIMVLVKDGEDLVLLKMNGCWKKDLMMKMFEGGDIDFLGDLVGLD